MNEKSEVQKIFNLKQINHLGNVSFNRKIYNFDTNYISNDIISISETIASTLANE